MSSARPCASLRQKHAVRISPSCIMPDGIELDGTNYLIPVDTALETDGDVLDETVPLDRVLFAVEPARQLRLIILDACRDNPFAKTMKRTITSRAIGRGLARLEPTSPN